VGDLISLMGSHNIIFEFYNARIARDIRNNENRATNCVARNIQKSVAAAARQMEAIGRLMESGKLDALPEPLRETALLRYRNPDATLDELREMHHPSISKSGLSHRLQKLIDAAEE
jgi:DNA-binding protein WhiA